MLTRCQRCSTVFNRVAGELVCPQCDAEDAQYTRRVEDYLAHYPSSPAQTVAAKTGVPVTFVQMYLGEAAADASPEDGPRTCQRCRAPAPPGAQLCNRCLILMRQELVEAARDKTPEQRHVSGIVSSRVGRETDFRSVRYAYTEPRDGDGREAHRP